MADQPRSKKRRKLRRWLARGRKTVREKILGVDDTPHRIAWGVALGFFLSMTPTLGLQIILYVATAWLLRANKVSGIPPLFISNPFTAVPLYYSTWWIGNLILTGGGDAGGGRAAIDNLIKATDEVGNQAGGMLSAEYWSTVGRALVDLGLEMWIGGFVSGLILAVIAYPFAYRSVVEYRARMSARKARRAQRRAMNA